MAPRDTRTEAFQAGQENPYIGSVGPLQRLYGTLGAIGEELGGSDMGTPFGTKFKERQSQTKTDIKRLQELRAKHPEEFGRGQMMAQQQADPYELGLGLGTLGMMTPYGRTTFDMAGGGAAPEGIFANPELSFRPRGRGPGPEGAPINAGFDVPRGMNRFEANQYYFTHGIPGEDIYRRSNYGGELPGYTPRGRFPSQGGEPIEMGAPYWPNAVPRDMNRFQANTYGMTYGRPGDTMHRFSNMDFVPENVPGQFGSLAPRGSTMPTAQRGGLPMMARGREIPYADYRDVTGNVLTGPAREAPYGGGMDFGVTREGQAMRGGVPYGRIAAGAAGVGLPMMMAYDNYRREPMGARPMPQGAMEAPRGAQQLPPIDIYGQRIPMAGMEAAPVAPAPRGKAPKAGKKAAPTPPKRPAEMSPQEAADFEGNLNYYVTQMLDRLTGQNEAERGRMTQQYYERNPY